MRTNLIRVGDMVINLDTVMSVDLDVTYDDDDEDQTPRVVIKFLMQGADSPDEGDNIVQPYVEVFDGDEAEALRSYFEANSEDILAS